MKLSLVIPVFNENENIHPLYQAIHDSLGLIESEAEIIFVDDCSEDATLTKLRELVEMDDRVRVLKLRKNSGQTEALAAGIANSRGEIIVTLDGDLQNDPRDIPALVSRIEQGQDLVTGWRRDRKDKFVTRRLPSLAANWCISRLLACEIHDLGCGLKAYRSELIRQIPLYSDLHRFLPVMCTMATSRIIEVEVHHNPRRHGKSKYGLSRIWKVLADVLAIKMLLSCAQRPLHWFGCWAFFVLFFSLFCGALSVVAAWRSGESIGYILPGAALLLGYLSTSLLFAGVFAEIVVRSRSRSPIRVLSDSFVLSEEYGAH